MAGRVAVQGWSLRVVLTVSVGLLFVLAQVAAATLVVVATLTGTTLQELTASSDTTRVTEGLETTLLVHTREANRLPRTPDALVAFADAEAWIRETLPQVKGYLATPTEDRLAGEVRERVQRYLDAQRAAEQVGRTPDAVATARDLLDEALVALRRLEALNLRQADEARLRAQTWDQRASTVGIGVAALLSMGAIVFLTWLWRFALRPVFALASALARFASGERSARVPEIGGEEVRSMARGFNEMADALQRERTNQMIFLAGVAHDLRNPLSTLKGSLQVLTRADQMPRPADPRVILERMTRQVDHLERMIGDLLETARSEAGALEIRAEECDARTLAREAAEAYDLASQVVLQVPSTPVWVRCDGDRMRQVLQNLISNAIKYSSPSSPVEVKVSSEDDVVLSVTDRGIGMNKTDLARIFEPFIRTGPARDAAGGVGLGLWGSRRIVEAHGGRIEVESTPGGGSTFRVRLPIEALPDPAPNRRRPGSAPPECHTAPRV